ncbi:non-specific lipid-transfer protein 1-like [Rhodamnia argentea]|uniref:Non-specific lipid-transfer protein n=1 Tax=Rhodamnia argentea TaxID=178133 RepID=A0ABM3HRC1_9MYRT|nr:non-specific lipid-transfer protein 1-like [Rhodamnia argentea]
MKGAALAVAAAAAMALIALMASPVEGITCPQVRKSLGPCASYLTKGGDPGSACCDGVRGLKNSTPYPADRRAACVCIKQLASQSHNIKADAAATLPGKCGVSIGVPIRADVDCNRIS